MRSLRGRLLAWVVLPLAGAVMLAGWISHRNAAQTASVVQDRLLVGSARIVAEQLRFEDGAIQAQVPPAALELFQASDVDRVFYRVIDGDGRTVRGYDELRLPHAALPLETPRFFDAVVRGQPVRAVAFLQPVLTGSGIAPVRVEIAQTMHGHSQLTRSLWLQAMVQQVMTIALVALLLIVGLQHAMRPLLRLRDAVLARRPGSARPLEIDAMPGELTPLVAAINEYARRLELHNEVQQAFLQNAAHQLRTPLTLLTTQVSYAVRTPETESRTESLAAIRRTVQQATHLVNQLLTLSAAQAQAPEEAKAPRERFDEVVRQVIEQMAGRAQAKDIDLGFEMSGEDARVVGHAVILREIATNLIDNAIRYTQPGGVVTSRIDSSGDAVLLTVEDNGPGIPVPERARVFERFYRLHDTDSDGCGLGLAIVQEFTARVGGRVALRTPASGRGVAVDVAFAKA
jgi:two-component system sensor histidine kinase TctE